MPNELIAARPSSIAKLCHRSITRKSAHQARLLSRIDLAMLSTSSVPLVSALRGRNARQQLVEIGAVVEHLADQRLEPQARHVAADDRVGVDRVGDPADRA